MFFSLHFSSESFKPGKSKREATARSSHGLRIEGRGRQSFAEWSFLQGYIWGPRQPQSLLLPILRGVTASAALEKQADGEGDLAGRPFARAPLSTGLPGPCLPPRIMKKNNKAKPPAGQHQYSTFHLAAKDPMSPGPASVRHDSNLQFLSQKGRRYRPLFMIRALFFAGNLINSYINSSLLRGAL